MSSGSPKLALPDGRQLALDGYDGVFYGLSACNVEHCIVVALCTETFSLVESTIPRFDAMLLLLAEVT